jgi:hypothetical protein
MPRTAAAVVEEDEEQDEYYEYNDERPNLEPPDRPTDERGERPTRSRVSPRWGPGRTKSR